MERPQPLHGRAAPTRRFGRRWLLGSGVLLLSGGCSAVTDRIAVYLNNAWNVYECRRLGWPVFRKLTLANGEETMLVDIERVGPTGRTTMDNWNRLQAGQSYRLDLKPVDTGDIFTAAHLTPVADIAVASLAEAYDIARLDRWDDGRVRLRSVRRPRSLAAGDLLVTADGRRFVVDIGGFEPLVARIPARRRQG